MSMKELKVGSKLFANYGAMYPTEELVVIDFEGIFVIARAEDGEISRIVFENIKPWGYRSANGSPIGVSLMPEELVEEEENEFEAEEDLAMYEMGLKEGK